MSVGYRLLQLELLKLLVHGHSFGILELALLLVPNNVADLLHPFVIISFAFTSLCYAPSRSL
jgi:hypothetical protein